MAAMVRILVVLILFSCMGKAFAQAVPGPADPGRIERNLSAPSPSGPAPAVPLKAAPEAGQEPPPPPVRGGYILRDVRIEGASAFPQERLRALYAPLILIGRRADRALAGWLAGRVTALYFSEGFFLSKAYVSRDGSTDGVIRISVVEGYVGRVDVAAPETFPARDPFGILRRTAAAIEAMRPLHGPTLERYMLLLNDTGHISAAATLYALPAESAAPGAVGLKLEIKSAAPSFFSRIDNHGSVYSGPWQAHLGASSATFLNALDSIGISAHGAFPLKEMRYGALDYAVPLGAGGHKAFFSAGRALTAPGGGLAAAEIKGETNTLRLGFSYPFIRRRAENFLLRASFEARNSEMETINNALLFSDRLRVLSLQANYDRIDEWRGQNFLSLGASKGLDVLGARETGSPDLSRLEGRSDFVKFTGQVARLQELPHDWQAYLRAEGQYAFTPLLSSEEYGYGGVSLGRAYDVSEILGDRGVAFSMELRFNGLHKNLQPFVGWDIGRVWNLDAGSVPVSASSAGAGLRFTFLEKISGEVAIGVPLTKPVANPVHGNGKSPRLTFQIGF
jgi:hemolysin activation/secretion protein